MRFSDLQGGSLTYANSKIDILGLNCNHENVDFIRYRLKVPNGKQKYSQPLKSPQFPFLSGLVDFNPIIDMTKPLIMVEGEKKAYVLCSKGIPAIGLTGINGFYRRGSGGENYLIAPGYMLIPGLSELLQNHKPGLVMLHDSDALEGSRQRKNAFFSTVKAFKALFPDNPLMYAMVKPSLGAKGIDDAFLANPGAKFKDLVDSLQVNSEEQLGEVRRRFFPSLGSKNWDALNRVLTDLNIVFRWDKRKYLLQCKSHGEHWSTLGNLDADICRELQLNGVNIGTAKLSEMLRSSAIAEPYDALATFFSLLPPWDGVDHIGLLCGFIDLHPDEDPVYFTNMLTKHLVRSVRCALEPTNVNRFVLVLHGGQGIGKTEFWRWLIPNELFYEETIDPKNKDSEFPLAQYLIINLDDLDELAKKEVAHLKSYISKSSIKQRPPYGRNIEEFVRIASFVGSTNRSDILADDVNTRWLILKVLEFDWKGYRQYVDPLMVWSQAYSLYLVDHDAGEITDHEKRIQAQRNGDYLENSMERELIVEYFEKGQSPFTMSDVFKVLSAKTTYRINHNSLTRELKRLCGEPINTRVEGVKGRYYYLTLRQVELTELERNWPSSRLSHNISA
jgi:hypothetical protein